MITDNGGRRNTAPGEYLRWWNRSELPANTVSVYTAGTSDENGSMVRPLS